ncbi:hypothetical protein SAMN06298210_11198 [Prevotellaceae bacterium KH2P17]|nr:hypothetical protein SAMN06298210_11198 [Prevotellaceae bacterium KH2P17]
MEIIHIFFFYECLNYIIFATTNKMDLEQEINHK